MNTTFWSLVIVFRLITIYRNSVTLKYIVLIGWLEMSLSADEGGRKVEDTTIIKITDGVWKTPG